MKILGILSAITALWKTPGYLRKGKEAVKEAREKKRMEDETGRKLRPGRMKDHRGRVRK